MVFDAQGDDDTGGSRDELIAALYCDAVRIADIAERARVCTKTVRNVARRRGLPPRNLSQPERDARIADRYRSGTPVGRIASEFGISRGRVRVIASRAGLPARSGWQRRYPIDESAFDNPSDVGWWLVGLLAADGSIDAQGNRVTLCQTLEDADVLHAFYAYVGCPARPLTMLNLSAAARARQLPRRPAAEARVFSSKIVKALAAHGVVPRKTSTMRLSDEAGSKAATWLGVLDGDGSVGIYRNGRAPRISFSGSRDLMGQCEAFWRATLGLSAPAPTVLKHSKQLWTFSLWGSRAIAAARTLVGASPISLLRKRQLLLQIAGSDGRQACVS